MKIVLIGAPGAGKGTQAQFICKHCQIPQISTGDMLRSALEACSELGLQAEKYMQTGKLVPDEVVIGLVLQRIAQPDCKDGFLFDGFPRSETQAQALIDHEIGIDYVIEIQVSQEEIIKRICGRRIHLASGRAYHIEHNPPKIEGQDDVTGEELIQREDDNAEVVASRLDAYQLQTAPLLNFYQCLADDNKKMMFYSVNGSQDIHQVQQDILKILT